MGKNLLKTIAPIAGALLGGPLLGGALGISGAGGAALGSGLGSFASGSTPLQAAGNALGNYFGGSLLGNAGNVGPGGSVASGLGSLGSFGSSVANALPSEIAGSSMSGLAGNYLGSQLGESVGTSLGGPPKVKTAQESPFAPSHKDAGNVPQGLSQFGDLSPDQQTTGIATQGVYGGGVGNDENQYFLNLVNNRLMDTGNMSSLKPIESSYLDQLGLGGAQNSNDLLKKISQYHYA